MSTLTSAASLDLETNGMPAPAAGPQKAPDRRLDVDTKQTQMAALLEESGCDALLVVEPANVAWLTSGAVARNILDPEEQPALFYTPTQRWLIASNVESQRMFDEEIDQLGFLLKEWPWHWGREQLLDDLCQGRRLAVDRRRGDRYLVVDQLRAARWIMTPYEQACCLQLGTTLAHALEATCRQANAGDSEREIAGQISHRLIHRGVNPTAISVAADGKADLYRRHAFTSAPIRKYAVLTATARKYGLYATASRSFSFGPPPDDFQNTHFAACKISATYIASSWPDALVREVFNAGKRIHLLAGFEHEWQRCYQGHITGRLPVERNFEPESADLLRAGFAVTWGPSIRGAASCDTVLVKESGPMLMTPTNNWPQVRVQVSGEEVLRPHILER